MKIITQTDDSGIIVMSLSGRLDFSSFQDFKDTYEKLFFSQPKGLIVDCKDVEMISSIGVKEIVNLFKRCTKHKVPFEVSNLNEKIFKIFQVSGLDKVIRLTRSE